MSEQAVGSGQYAVNGEVGAERRVRAGTPPAGSATAHRAPPLPAYVAGGLALLRADWPAYLLITLAYAAPALLAAGLAVAEPAPPAWLEPIVAGLPGLTAVLGTVAFMVAIGDSAHGRPVRLGRASRLALLWTPRYLWTNAHTALLFWLPMTLLAQLWTWAAAAWPAAGPVLEPLWWPVAAVVAVTLHTRTLLAPFLAVHGDLPGTLATLEAWRLSGRHFRLCLGVFLLGSLPVALPLSLLAGTGLLLGGEPVGPALAVAGPALLWAAIQAVRPVLMPAVYLLYGDLWRAETARRAATGAPPTPGWARALLALTRPLPHPPAR